jgi:hypothetical protein
MIEMLPYLSVGGVEVVNNCRTNAYIANVGAPPVGVAQAAWHPGRLWRPAEGPCDCCCDLHEDDTYTWPSDPLNPAPWFDPVIPASAEAFGFLVDGDGVDVERVDDARVKSEGLPAFISVTGTVVSSTRRGHQYMVRWLRSRFADCPACGGIEVRLSEFCGTVDAYQLPAPAVALTLTAPERAALTPPATGPIAAASPFNDRGWRALHGVAFASIDAIEDEPFPYAQGARYVLTLSTDREHMLSDPFFTATIGGFDASFCTDAPLVVTPQDLDVLCTVCGVPCHCIDLTPFNPDFGGRPGEPGGLPALVPLLPYEQPAPGCSAVATCAMASGLTIDQATRRIRVPDNGGGVYRVTSVMQPVSPLLDPMFAAWVAYFDCVGWTVADPNNAAIQLGLWDYLSSGWRLPTQPAFGLFARPQAWLYPTIDAFFVAPSTLTTEYYEIGPSGITHVVSYIVSGVPSSETSPPVINPPLWEFAAPDLACLLELTAVRPTLNGQVMDGFEQPFPALYNGELMLDGYAFAAALSAERGCVITWTGAEHATNRHSYMLPGDCVRRAVANLVSPPTYVAPMYEWQTIPNFCPPFPVYYGTTLVNDGDQFAALLSAERGCTITWQDAAHPSHPCTYAVPFDCQRREVACLTAAPFRDAVGDCWAQPIDCTREARLIPTLPVDSVMRVTVSNGALPVYNAQILIYEYVAALPHILNDDLIVPSYRLEDPVRIGRITGLQPNVDLVIDGRTGCSWLDCPGGERLPPQGVLSAEDQRPYLVPTLRAGSAYWVEVLLSCDPSPPPLLPILSSYGNLDLTVTLDVFPVVP